MIQYAVIEIWTKAKFSVMNVTLCAFSKKYRRNFYWNGL